jgi:hypothetical protein
MIRCFMWRATFCAKRRNPSRYKGVAALHGGAGRRCGLNEAPSTHLLPQGAASELVHRGCVYQIEACCAPTSNAHRLREELKPFGAGCVKLTLSSPDLARMPSSCASKFTVLDPALRLVFRSRPTPKGSPPPVQARRETRGGGMSFVLGRCRPEYHNE